MSDNAIEQEIQAKGLTAPRVTPADIEAEIASEHYFTALDGVTESRCPSRPDGLVSAEHQDALGSVTFCLLILRNGCKVVGINHGPVDPAGFDAEYGRKDARADAIRQVWPLLGFRLRDKLAVVDVEEANLATHDMQLNGTAGIWTCTRCGESMPKRRSCAERQALLAARGLSER